MNLTKEQINDLRSQLWIKVGNPKFPEFKDLGEISWWYIDDYSNISTFDGEDACDSHRNIRATEEQANACLALSQLSQLMKHVNGDWNPADDDRETKRYNIYKCYWKLDTRIETDNDLFLKFPTEEIRDWFLEAYKDLIEIAKPLL